MAGLAGISPIAGFVVEAPEATAEQRLGGAADPRHAQAYHQLRERRPWELQAWALTAPARPGVQPGLPDEQTGIAALPAGTGQLGTPYFGATPVRSHAAPWPKGVETSIQPHGDGRGTDHLAQSAAIHAVGMGETQHWFAISATQDRWQEDWNPGPEDRTLQQPVNGQVRQAAGGWGSTDRSGNPRGVNEHDFGNAHLHRRYARGSVPGNYLWMRPGGRPMVKSVPGPARPPIGDASPFTGQDLRVTFSTRGAILRTPAADYEAPPDPYTAPPLSAQQHARPADVAWW